MPTAGELQHLLWGTVSTALYALPWILGGFGALAFLSFGPIGKALRRLARGRDEETALLGTTAASIADMRTLLEQLAERQDYMERTLSQQVHPQQLLKATPEVTPH